jgi:hypothetical protein
MAESPGVTRYRDPSEPLTSRVAELAPNGLCQIGRVSQPNSPAGSAQITNAIPSSLTEQTRLGMPALFNKDGLHGLMVGRTSSTTIQFL